MEKIILDCDPGLDDAMALAMAVASPKIELLGVTSSAGNQTADKTLNNVLRVLTLLNRKDIPVAGGNKVPLIKPLFVADYVHGETGLDGAEIPDPGFDPVDLTAVELIAKILREQPEPITLVVTGPMTNIALFIRTYPDLIPQIKQIVFMGGSSVAGNATPVAEFNIFVDPDAAKIVLNSGIKTVMAGLNLTHQAQLFPSDVAKIKALGNPVAIAMAGFMDFYNHYYMGKSADFKGAPLHDPCTIAWLIAPELFESKTCNVDVENISPLTLGETVCDLDHLTDRPQNTDVLTKIDREKFVDLVESLLTTY